MTFLMIIEWLLQVIISPQRVRCTPRSVAVQKSIPLFLPPWGRFTLFSFCSATQ